ncbi:dihydrodipicolinate synthase family protein [Nocardioides euryhalodurans]|uniref:Dihydrodipicolinate synthase family protein n=1 Tax=Nocardioides euryhalodurans TaxID=2518370 RepID=A0A4P7GJW2_9ACTN|nr:dihydrodipicolinate synthase family protein [Nocardioides euryhalodurans]QBR92310.1 dihydrodipicolinate synthase family protein [Nocardioides euryhalodurans]
MTSLDTATSLGTVRIPLADGGTEEVALREPRAWAEHPRPFRTRVAFAAAHVVADPRGENVPGAPAVVDWESTLGFRRHLFRHGFGVAEAMDTAQRNMGLDWPAVQELVSRSAVQARDHGARIAAGAGTDHVGPLATVAEVRGAYAEQVAFVEDTGAQVILMASRQLAAVAVSPDDYLGVYADLLRQVREPVVLHWLGEAFDPQLRGYWGSTDTAAATATFLDLVRAHADKVDGVKVSLLSAEHEVGLRAALPEGVRLYTGDDFHYPELIRGDGEHHSDALLGAFAAVTPAASAALAALDEGDLATYDAEMAPTLPLSRHVFEAPTWHYKTGIAFLSWLSGHQPGFTMVGGMQSSRSVVHLGRLFALANEARLLPDPQLAARRLELWLAGAGVAS